MFDENGKVISMARYRAANTWGDSYITGEFAYFIRPYSKDLVPYNFTIIDRVNGKPDPRYGAAPRTFVTPSPEIYASARRAVSTLGYRIVLGSPKVTRTEEGAEASFTLANVGTSRAYHSYNRLRVFVERDGQAVKLASTSGNVRVSFPDAKGIEHPLCLSNYGRRASDGSYLLGTVATDARSRRSATLP